MGVKKYTNKQGTFWKVDMWITLPDGRGERIQRRKIPTRELAVALEAKTRSEAFEGRYFERLRVPKVTVAQLWKEWEPISRRDKDSWQSDVARARYLCEILGDRIASGLTQRDIDEYRNRRLADHTRRKNPPSPASLDREIAQLKRMCSYAVECGLLQTNPVAKVKLLNKPNVRRTVIDEQTFAKLLAIADPELRPILVVAYDTGMRKGEILNLRWSQVDLRIGAVKLSAEDTKTNFARTVYLTGRALQTLKAIPRRLDSEYVFVNPETGTRWEDARKLFIRARRKAGLQHVWFHDLRRSFVTNARRRGVAESVVMRMSGHRTRNVFDRYNIVEDEDVRNAVKVIEAGAARDVAESEGLSL
jgi:integrase